MEIQYNEGYFFVEITKEEFKERGGTEDENIKKLLADGNAVKTLLLIAITECPDDSNRFYVRDFDKIFIYFPEYEYSSIDDDVLLKVVDKEQKERYFIFCNGPIKIYFGQSYNRNNLEAAYYNQSELFDCGPKDFIKYIDYFVSQLPESPELIGIYVTL